MRLNDKIWAVLAMFSFVLIAVVIYANRNSNYEGKEYNANSYYEIPISNKNLDEKDVYASILNNGNEQTCPATSLEQSEKGLIRFGKGDSTFLHNVWITTADSYEDLTDGGTFTTGDFEKVKEILKLEDIVDKSSFTYREFGCEEPTKAYEIVAPFNFVFANNNTSDDGCIIIYSVDNKVKITFERVLNWFCAGYPGADYTVKSGWSEHGKDSNPHYSIYGSSANSKISNGTAGDVIGYAGPDTTVRIEAMSGSMWNETSLKMWLTGK